MLVTAAGVRSAVRMGIMGGSGTLAGADSLVVTRTTGGSVTTGIIVIETLLWGYDYEGVIVYRIV